MARKTHTTPPAQPPTKQRFLSNPRINPQHLLEKSYSRMSPKCCNQFRQIQNNICSTYNSWSPPVSTGLQRSEWTYGLKVVKTSLFGAFTSHPLTQEKKGCILKDLPFILLFPNHFTFYCIPVFAYLLSSHFYLCRSIHLLHFLQLHLLKIIIALSISRWHYQLGNCGQRSQILHTVRQLLSF